MSPVVVAVSGVQGQLGCDVDAYACHCAEAHAADAAALVDGVVGIGRSLFDIVNGNGYLVFYSNAVFDFA